MNYVDMLNLLLVSYLVTVVVGGIIGICYAIYTLWKGWK